MKLDRNSRGTVALVWFAGLAIIYLLHRFIPGLPVITWSITTIIAFVIGFITFFFRVPVRPYAGDDKKVSAVADGKIVILEKVFEPLFLNRECIQMSIYMDFFDVHANFWPLTAEVVDTKYYPGEHFLAFKPKASEENEHTATLLRNRDGQEVLFKQLAGGFARRIVCYAKPGLQTIAGHQCGVIKFGSRIDIYLPLDSTVHVRVGDTVRACETVIATLKQ